MSAPTMKELTRDQELALLAVRSRPNHDIGAIYGFVASQMSVHELDDSLNELIARKHIQTHRNGEGEVCYRSGPVEYAGPLYWWGV